MQKERVIWIDIAKIIGIYLVILGHIVNDAKPIESEIFTLIYSFHMPFFFFISGYLFRVKESQFDQFVWNKTKSIIVPYFLLNIAAAVLHIPMYIQQHHVPVQELLSCVDGRMGTAFSGATWFLICLFIIMVLAYWVEQVPRLYQILITIISAILAYCVSNHQLPFDLHLIPCSFAFFYVGRLVSGKIPNLKQYRFSLVLLPISTIVVAVLFVLLALYNGSVSIDGMYGKTVWLYFPVAFLGITMVVLLSQWLSIYLSIYLSIPFITRILSAGTIIILALHHTLLDYTMDFFLVQHSFLIPLVAREVILSALVLTCFVPINWLIERYAPILNGNRK